MKKILCLLLGSVFFSHGLFATDVFNIYDEKQPIACNDVEIKGSIGLSEAMEKAVCANPALKISYLSALVSGASYGQGLSEYLPSITVSGSLSTHSSKEDGGDSTDQASLAANAKLSWLLLDFGGRSANTDRLKTAMQSSYFLYDEKLQSLLYDVAKNYYSVLSAVEKYEGLVESEKSFKKAFEEASSRYELGLVPLSDKLQAQTSYEQAKLACNVAKKNIALEQGKLANLLDLPPYTSFDLVRPDKKLKKMPPMKEIKELINTALEKRPDYKSTEKDVLSAQNQVAVSKSEGLPSLSGNLSASADRDVRDGNRAMYSGSAGLSISFPLFTGFSQSYKISQAQLRYQSALETLEAKKNAVENEVWSAVQEYETSLESFKITETLLNSAKENERVAFEAYKVGKVNILTLLDAQASLASARVENSTSFYNFLTAIHTLRKALGQMESIK